MPRRAKPASPLAVIPRRYHRYATAFLAAVGVLAAVVLLASLARVRIVITPRPAPLAVDIEVAVIGSGIARAGAVQGRLVRAEGTALVRSGGAPTPATSAPASTDAPSRARGTVTLVNTHVAAQPLVATTRLLTPDGVLFRLEKGVVIPAKGKVDGVSAYADQPGAQGNSAPTKFTIPGLSTWLQQRVWAESTAAMSGGSGTPPVTATARVRVPSTVAAPTVDVAALRTRAQAAAKEDAMQRALAMAKPGEALIALDASPRIDVTGAEARGAVTITALLVEQLALEAVARTALETKATAAGQTLRRLRSGSLAWRVARADGAAARATLLVHAEGETTVAREFRSFDPRRIAGFRQEDVATYLKSIPGVEEVEVTFWPAWVRRVPTSTGVVRVEVREPRR